MKTAVVLGGGGFIGASVTKRSVELGWQDDSLGLLIPSDQNKKAGVD